MISLSSRKSSGEDSGYMGHMRCHLGFEERFRDGHMLQMLFFHWFYKHFYASREAAGEARMIEVVGTESPWAVFHWF